MYSIKKRGKMKKKDWCSKMNMDTWDDQYA